MKKVKLLNVLLVYLMIGCHCLYGQQTNAEKWWPHPEWGEGDQAGATNRINASTIQRAIATIQYGKMVELSFIHEASMPVSTGRSFKLISPSFPTGGPAGQNDIVWNDDYFSGELGHVGTQFDALSHIGVRMTNTDERIEDRYYNGFKGSELKSAYGVRKLGIEHIRPIVTRCFLINIAAYKGVETLLEGYTVTLADVLGAMKAQAIDPEDIQEGDAVFFNYGWWRHWPDRHKVLASRPGINREVANWLIGRKISVVGSDNSTDQGGTHAVHFDMLVKHGISNLEFMNFSEILAENVDRFALFFTPIRMKGATGSPARPIAIY